MDPAVIQEQEIQAVGEGWRKGVDQGLETLGIAGGPFEEEPLTRRGRDGAM